MLCGPLRRELTVSVYSHTLKNTFLTKTGDIVDLIVDQFNQYFGMVEVAFTFA